MDLGEKKEHLIRELLDLGYLKSESVIKAFRKVPREEFVLPQHRDNAYANEPLPILEGQTISQPLTVAAMTEALSAESGQKILEVGSGSGYQAAILAELAGKSGKVITLERLEPLLKLAKRNLQRCGYAGVVVILSDGSEGYQQEAPYDRIIVTASAPHVPEPLLEQLKEGGKLVIPVKDELLLIEKLREKEFKKTFLGYYAFVPLVGKFGHEG